MNLLQAALRSVVPAQRSQFNVIGFEQWAQMLSQQGLLLNQTLLGKVEQIENNFPGLVSMAYKGNSMVFGLEMLRVLLFAQARFIFRQLRSGQPGDLFGSPELRIFEKPWPNATTGDLLARILLYNDFAGNAYVVRRPSGFLALPRPDWMTILIGTPNPDDDPWDIDAQIVGYQYHPGGIGVGRPQSFLPNEVAHFALTPDPLARFRGMSWLTPVLREIESDSAATAHKLAYFRNGATANMVVKVDNPAIKTPEDFRTWIELFEQEHTGATNAYRTLYLTGGADATVVGANLDQIDFKITQGAGETRLAVAANVPPAVAGISEGLQGSALNSGNYTSAKRRFADLFARPAWENVAGSLAALINVPNAAELWYLDKHIPFLREDMKDAAEALSTNAQAIKALTDAGYESQSVIDAVTSGDLTRLSHTGLFSVQLQPPGSNQPEPAVPQLPATTPTPAPGRSADEVRCPKCSKLIVESITAGAGYRATCPRCKTVTEVIEGELVSSRDIIDSEDRSERLISALVAIAERPQPEPPVVNIENHHHFDEGAFPVTIERGAIAIESPVTVRLPDPPALPEPRPMSLRVVKGPRGTEIVEEPA